MTAPKKMLPASGRGYTWRLASKGKTQKPFVDAEDSQARLMSQEEELIGGGTYDAGQNINSQRHCFKASAADGANNQRANISITEVKATRTTQKSAINHQQFLKKIK